MKIRKSLAALATAAALSGGLIAMPTQWASASDDTCYAGVRNNSSDTVRMIYTLNLKKGPYARCANGHKAYKGQIMYVWCLTRNVYGNYWLYGRIKGTSSKGWVEAKNTHHLSGKTGACS